ncbi:hypothetical protein CHLNCDRAFT_136121 [Chlorella variabilis]|uniref:Uncharacterized protein n=1 Tax=Chlorella variabilis TaxID=554065 RepID=E1ZJT2_CHLVA|nr:hypothetical protein CHLNCDRAFT_136121 [Chlorella variabilis]EFN54047.1 hypothetical protein CHLNCDRAFT_136121 [Chlorella variabilis]|eukprot:XP_005846149.1 hypothetical protein CHLNCDRAFT_136121 [Chlorella variabilis]
MTDHKEKELTSALSDCVLESSWLCTVVAVALAVPLGVRQKSYMPVVYLGLAGTVMDLLNGYDKCKEQRQALERYLQNREAFGQQPTSVERQLGGGDND